MKTKIVYVLVSDGSDSFMEMTVLSLRSLFQYNPNAKVEIVSDSSTAALFTTNYGGSFKQVCIISVDIPAEYDKKSRSRYLKTSLRTIIRGDFIFVDCDTLICESLEDIDSVVCALGCVLDYHIEKKLFDQTKLENCFKAGIKDVEGQPYYNSGVLFCKDIYANYLFFEEWHRLWLSSREHGSCLDQPAFCRANINLGFPIKELSGIWNCQIQCKEGGAFLSRAKIIHYFSYTTKSSVCKNFLFNTIKNTRGVSAPIYRIVRNPRTIGVTIFTSAMAGTGPVADYLYSDLIYSYCYAQPLYRFLLFLARWLTKPTVWLIRLFKGSR